jgi:hypothetical protein
MKGKLPRWVEFSVWLLGTCVFIACAQFLVLFISNPGTWLNYLRYNPTPTPTEEILRLPVNTDDNKYTSQVYSGWVTITIRGEGQYDAETRHSAFGLYTEDQKLGRFDGFTIDGQGLLLRVFVMVPTPIAPTEHEYRFLYWVEAGPRRIGFRMVNGNSADQSEFTVEITSRNLVSSGGR